MRVQLDKTDREVITTWTLSTTTRVVLPNVHNQPGVRFLLDTIKVTMTSRNKEPLTTFWGYPLNADGRKMSRTAEVFQPHTPSARSLVPEIEKVINRSVNREEAPDVS